MLTTYLICAILGGGMVLLSAFMGDKDGHDADKDLHVDHDKDLAVGKSFGKGDILAPQEGEGPWIPILSLKFWTFSAAFFGLTGALLHAVAGLAVGIEVALALATGVSTGLGVTWSLRKLRQSQVTSSVSDQRLIGAEGRMLLPVAPGQPGKIGVELQGRRIDYIAISDEESLGRGDPAAIIAVEGNQVRVTRARNLLPADALDPDE